jgi:thiol:disulfide interchange protein
LIPRAGPKGGIALRINRSFGCAALAVVAIASLIASGDYAGTRPAGRRAPRERIKWARDIDAGIAAAKKEGKPLMIDFMATWCPPCRAMEDSTFSKPEVVKKISAFVPVRIDIDKQRAVATKYNGLARKYGGIGIPNILFMTADERMLRRIVGYYPADSLVSVMDSVLTVVEGAAR